MKFIEVISMERPDCLAWRNKGIGSSDAAVVMGVSRFKKYGDLLIEKATKFTGEDQSNTFIKDRGNKIEIKVRTFLEQETGMSFSPMSCQMVDFPFIKSTLDGATKDRTIITEIKLLSTQKEDKINKKSEGYLKWEDLKNGTVPTEYWPQVQHQLMVTGAKKCIFKGYYELRPVAGYNQDTKKPYYGDAPVDNNYLATVEVLPDKEYIRFLISQEVNFWYEVEMKRDELNSIKGDELE